MSYTIFREPTSGYGFVLAILINLLALEIHFCAFDTNSFVQDQIRELVIMLLPSILGYS